MRCLLLGGGGFLGSHLADKLLSAGYFVRILDRPNLKKFRKFTADENVEWYEGDLLNSQDMEAAVLDCEYVFHFAYTTLPKNSNENPVYDVETNVISTLKLLELLKSHSPKKIVFISSGGTIYGVPEVVPIPESHANFPICSYGITKLTIEKYLHMYNQLYDLDYAILRLSNPYGPRQRIDCAQGAVSAFLHKAVKREPIEIWGDGCVVRDYIYIDDVTAAMLDVLNHSGQEKIFNISSGEGRTLREIVAAIEQVVGYPLDCNFSEGRRFDVPANVLVNNLAKRCLDWQPEISLQQGIQKYHDWIIHESGQLL